MDDVAKKLGAIEWIYASADRSALQQLTDRIRATARQADVISYTKLVEGITFQQAKLNEGKPFQIHNWSSEMRRMLGDFLGCIAADSYLESGFLASAVAVASTDPPAPSRPFFEWALDLGLLKNDTETRVVLHVGLSYSRGSESAEPRGEGISGVVRGGPRVGSNSNSNRHSLIGSQGRRKSAPLRLNFRSA